MADTGDIQIPYRWLLNGDPPIAWRDEPDLTIGVLYVIRHVARQRGYAVAHHGSLSRDLDLIAVPWTHMACPVDDLIDAIKHAIGSEYTPGQANPSLRPHGRLSYAMNLHPTGQYVDLSVFPPVTPEANDAQPK